MIEEKIIYLSNKLFHDSTIESNYHPIDRFFIIKKGYLNDIKKFNSLDFILYNLEKTPNTYSEQLLLCLPELWDDIGFNEIVLLMERFTSSFSFYAFIRFIYKYLELDILDIVLINSSINLKFKKDILNYFKNIISTFYKDEDDYLVFEENLLGVDIGKWNYIKQKLLLNERIKPFEMSQQEFYLKIVSLDKYYNP